MELPEIRRRVRAAIENARAESAARRQRADAASQAYSVFLEQRAVPTFHVVASALAGDGHRFKVFTPAGSVRLSSEGAAEDFIELSLDVSQDPPRVMGQTSRGRGRRSTSSERPLGPGRDVEQLTEEDVLEFLLDEIGPLVER